MTIETLAVMVQKGFEEITALFREEISGVQGEMNGVRGEVEGVRGALDGFRGEVSDQFLHVNARLDSIDLDFSTMRDDRHRIKLLEDDVAAIKKKIV